MNTTYTINPISDIPNSVTFIVDRDTIFTQSDSGKYSWKKALTDEEEIRKIIEQLMKSPLALESFFEMAYEAIEDETFAPWRKELEKQFGNVLTLC